MEISATLTIQNRQGLHLRAVKQLVEESLKYASHIVLVKDGREVDAKSIMDVMSLGATFETELDLMAVGPDAESAVEALKTLVNRKFNEEEYGD